jgi:hypothetical protein
MLTSFFILITLLDFLLRCTCKSAPALLVFVSFNVIHTILRSNCELCELCEREIDLVFFYLFSLGNEKITVVPEFRSDLNSNLPLYSAANSLA